MTNASQKERAEGYEHAAPIIAEVVPLAERTEDRRAKLMRALAEIRQMDEDTASLKAIVDTQKQRIGELEQMLDFLDKRCQSLDDDRMTYAKQVVLLSAQVATIWHAAERAVAIANAAEALGIGGVEKGTAGA